MREKSFIRHKDRLNENQVAQRSREVTAPALDACSSAWSECPTELLSCPALAGEARATEAVPSYDGAIKYL